MTWFSILHVGYVVGEWRGYGQIGELELMSGLALAWGNVYTSIELFKVIPNTHIHTIGLCMCIGTFLWTYRRATEGFWDTPLTVNATYSAVLSGVFGWILKIRLDEASV
eukprot:8333827-Pyramimonas_sp.AAC.3